MLSISSLTESQQEMEMRINVAFGYDTRRMYHHLNDYLDVIGQVHSVVRIKTGIILSIWNDVKPCFSKESEEQAVFQVDNKNFLKYIARPTKAIENTIRELGKEYLINIDVRGEHVAPCEMLKSGDMVVVTNVHLSKRGKMYLTLYPNDYYQKGIKIISVAFPDNRFQRLKRKVLDRISATIMQECTQELEEVDFEVPDIPAEGRKNNRYNFTNMRTLRRFNCLYTTQNGCLDSADSSSKEKMDAQPAEDSNMVINDADFWNQEEMPNISQKQMINKKCQTDLAGIHRNFGEIAETGTPQSIININSLVLLAEGNKMSSSFISELLSIAKKIETYGEDTTEEDNMKKTKKRTIGEVAEECSKDDADRKKKKKCKKNKKDKEEPAKEDEVEIPDDDNIKRIDGKKKKKKKSKHDAEVEDLEENDHNEQPDRKKKKKKRQNDLAERPVEIEDENHEESEKKKKRKKNHMDKKNTSEKRPVVSE